MIEQALWPTKVLKHVMDCKLNLEINNLLKQKSIIILGGNQKIPSWLFSKWTIFNEDVACNMNTIKKCLNLLKIVCDYCHHYILLM